MPNSTIPLQFKLATFQPGSRGYNNGIFEPDSEFRVVVDVPLETQYVANAEKILVDLVGGTNTPPILTVQGWAFVENIFLNRAVIEKSDENSIEWEGD